MELHREEREVLRRLLDPLSPGQPGFAHGTFSGDGRSLDGILESKWARLLAIEEKFQQVEETASTTDFSEER